MKELGQKLHKAIAVVNKLAPKIALAKYLAYAKLGWCNFFQKPNVALVDLLVKEPLYFDNYFGFWKNLIFDSFLFQELAKLLEHQHGYIDLHNIPENKYYSMTQTSDEDEKL